MVQPKRKKRIVGWKEHIALPDLKVKQVIAKIDTGANVASIDASEIKIVKRQGVKYVTFKIMKRNNTVKYSLAWRISWALLFSSSYQCAPQWFRTLRKYFLPNQKAHQSYGKVFH